MCARASLHYAKKVGLELAVTRAGSSKSQEAPRCKLRSQLNQQIRIPTLVSKISYGVAADHIEFHQKKTTTFLTV